MRVIVLDDVSCEVEQLSLTIKNKIKNSFLDKYIKTPVINKDKLTILSILLKQSSTPVVKHEIYIIATMLVQSALDTHDQVKVTNQFDQKEVDVTSRQLTVLAGDYYSALYYSLLADIDDIDMIQVLASSIKEINEYKMQLYYMEFDSFSDYITAIHKIDTSLLTHVASFLGESILIKLINQLLLALRLIDIKQAIENKNEPQILQNWFEYSTSSTKQSILNKVEGMIQKNMSNLEITFTNKSINNSMVQSQFNWLIKPVFSRTSVVGGG